MFFVKKDHIFYEENCENRLSGPYYHLTHPVYYILEHLVNILSTTLYYSLLPGFICLDQQDFDLHRCKQVSTGNTQHSHNSQRLSCIQSLNKTTVEFIHHLYLFSIHQSGWHFMTKSSLLLLG